MLTRVARLRCPACGHGRLFRRLFVRKDLCGHCGWEFERGAGHWVGGSEVHMFASYGLSVILFVPVLVLVTPTPALLGAVIAGHVVLSLLLFRWSRALFLGIDYFIDPARPDHDDDDGPGGMPAVLPDPLPGLAAHDGERNVVARR
jgi:uncharacterized protein (DUF983 family)